MPRIRSILVIAAIIISATLLFFAPLFKPGDPITFDTEQVYELNNGWTYTDADGQLNPITLPCFVTVPLGGVLVISTTLPEQTKLDNTTLCLRTSRQSAVVYLDGQEIASIGTNYDNYVSGLPGSITSLVRLPEGCSGKKLEIAFSSLNPNYSVIINPIVYGTKAACLFYILRNNIAGLVIAALLFTLGALLSALELVRKRSHQGNRTILYLGLSAMLAALWVLGESKCIQLITDNYFLATSLPFFGLMLFPMPFCLYLDAAVPAQKPRKSTNIVFFSMIVAFVITLFFVIVLGYDFVSLLFITHIVIVISALWALWMLCYEALKNRSKEAIHQLMALSVLVAAGAMELSVFYGNMMGHLSYYFRAGLLLYFCLLGVLAVKRIRDIDVLNRERAHFEKLAYSDMLTGGLNRTAYYKDISKNPDPGELVCVAMCDVDQLKQINDTYGHSCGDRAIKAAYDSLMEICPPSGTCYRIGGDEFLCLFKNVEIDEIKLKLESLDKITKEKSRELPFELHLAVGLAQYDPALDASLELTSVRADKLMYINKCEFEKK